MVTAMKSMAYRFGTTERAMVVDLSYLVVLFCAFLLVPSFAELPRFEHQLKRDGSLSLLVVGDWGRKGLYNQSEVAFQMGRIGEKLDIDFVISTGDNFYDNGLKSVNDPAFKESFTDIYTAKSLQKQWYSVLGNHDYRGDAVAQLTPFLREIEKRWLCLRSFVLKTEIAEFFFVDTTPFVDKYFTEPDHDYDWRGIEPRRTYIANLLKDLKSEIKNSTAKWKIVVGHHAIRSVGHHGDTPELIKHLLPILKANDVDLYINGHDHCLEHISSLDSSIQYLTSGGGSKAWRGDVRSYDHHAVKFVHDGQGFMSLKMTEKSAMIAFYDVAGKGLHRWKVSKQSKSAV